MTDPVVHSSRLFISAVIGAASMLSLGSASWVPHAAAAPSGPSTALDEEKGASAVASTPTVASGEPVVAGAAIDPATIPSGWSRRSAGGATLMIAPGGMRVLIASGIVAADAGAAVAAAARTFGPAPGIAIRAVLPQSPRQGWDERYSVSYDLPPNSTRALRAAAFRQGDRWTAMIVDGERGSVERDMAALSVIEQGIHPTGYVPDDFRGRVARPLDPERLELLREFVEKAMGELGVPGAAIAVTTRERTVYARGIGVRLLGEAAKVDGDTRFAIASNTKSLSTLMMARLVDQGRLRWNEPVIRAYPGFRLGSPETTRGTMVRHMVCACTGLPRTDYPSLFNVGSGDLAADTFAQLAATEPTSRFGSQYQYNNLIVSGAGYVAGNVAHPSLGPVVGYETAMREQVFAPLAMTRTTLDFDAATKGNWARPHADGLDGHPVPILGAGLSLDYALGRYGAAAGAWSTANDLARYARMELNEGLTDTGDRYVTARNLLERRVESVRISRNETYGLGLIVNREDGVETIEHGGGLWGYRSAFVVIPRAGIAAVILTNGDKGWALLPTFRRRLVELLYGGREEAAADVRTAAIRNRADLANALARTSTTPARDAVEALAVRYANPELGPLDVDRAGGGVRFRFGTFASAMGTRRDGEVSSFVTLDPALPFLPFVVGEAKGRRTLTVRDGQHSYVFVET